MNKPFRFGRTALASSVLLFLLAGCSQIGGVGEPPDSVTASPSLPAPSGASSFPVQVYDRSGRNQAGFMSPNGNISCKFTAAASTDTDPTGQVRCDIVVKDWQSPPRPSSCQVAWGSGVSLGTQAAVLCSGDTIRGDVLAGTDGSVTLPFGTSIRFAPFTCTSQKSGVECLNTATKAGFLISRERYELRNP